MRTRSRAAVAGTTALAALVGGWLVATDGSGEGQDRIDARRFVEAYQEGRDEEGFLTSLLSGGGDTSASEAGAPVAQPSSVPDQVQPAPWPEPTEDNVFVDPGRNGVVLTEQDPLSTFSLDVDTGSFSVARETLAAGALPDPAGVRTEEWVNALDHGYAPPSDSDFGVVTGSLVREDGTELVRVGVRARDVALEDRPPANVTFVVDVSGSMDIRERLGLVQSSLALLANNLGEDDTISLVTYGSTARVVLEPTAATHTAAVVEAIEALRPDGSTNLEAGLRLGYEQARSAYREDAINAVVLASDGVANVGETGPGSLAETIREQGQGGVHLVSVGFGLGNYDDHTMEQLADQGDGFYSHVDTFEEAERLFGTDLTGTLTVVAQETRAQVAFDPAQVASYRLLGYENRALADEDFADDSVDAGEIGAGHAVTALYEVVRTAGATGDVVGEVGLRWRSTADGDVHEQSWLVATGAPDPALELAAVVATTAELLRDGGRQDLGSDLDAVLADARRLADRDVAGADDLVALVGAAQEVVRSG